MRPRLNPLFLLKAIARNYFFAIIGSAAVALLIRIYIIEAFLIPTDLMAPTLLPGDHIFVNKLASRQPARGDVVVFAFPNEQNKEYIKRVVGIEGDHVEIQNGHVILNGKDINKDLRSIATDTPNSLLEEALDNHSYQVSWEGAPLQSRKMIRVTIPPGHLFVLGDNRAKGQDSRVWGFLPVSYIRGRALLVWFSKENLNNSEIRWSRILKRVL